MKLVYLLKESFEKSVPSLLNVTVRSHVTFHSGRSILSPLDLRSKTTVTATGLSSVGVKDPNSK